MKKNDLTQGHIIKKILIVAIPAVLSSLVQMTYNLTDMFWISRVTTIGIDNTKAIAAIGTTGYYLWLGWGLIMLTKIGLDAFIPQSAGKDDDVSLNEYATSGIYLTLVIAFIYSMLGFFFKERVIGIFNMEDELVVSYAVNYLSIISLFVYFHFINPIFTSIYNGLGKTIIPFIVNSIGIVLNIIIDPVFILVFKMGVTGAAVATIISQLTVTLIYIWIFTSKKRPIKLDFSKYKLSRMVEIVKISFPIALQSVLFTSIAIYIGVLVASFGPGALATQRIGSQIESLAWMIAGGFSVALSAFVGQNIGAKKYDRIEIGFFKTLKPIIVYGVTLNIILFIGANQFFKIFNPSIDVLEMGATYLKILSFSQLFMVVEISIQGAFNGAGKNFPPSFVGIVFNFLRIPGAIYLSSKLGLNGVWLAISITSVFKGVILLAWWIFVMKRRKYVTIKEAI